MWTEHRNPEGRTYWFNTASSQSVWEKPDDLKTSFEKALGQTKWKEYFSGGKKYFYNTENKESKWEMPEELKDLEKKIKEEASGTNLPVLSQGQIIAPGFTPIGSTQGALVPQGGTTPSSSAQQPNGDLALVRANGLPLAVTSVLPGRPNLPDDPVIPHNGFTTVEEGEKAFTHLLKKAGVDPTWTWDQTMRGIITDPLYKSLNSLSEKKAVFEKYTAALKAKEIEDRESRLAKLRPALRNMLKGNPNVFHYSTFATADNLFAQHPIWQQARIENERRFIFEEYVGELKQREIQESRQSKTRSIQKVMNLLKELQVDVTTRWREAYRSVQETEEYKEDIDLQKLPPLDVLLAFEDYSRVREREFEEQVRRSRVAKTRRERKAREAFKELLHGLIDTGKIKARTQWKGVYPMFKDDERYLNILGKPGSSPIELFWDVVDILDQRLDAKIDVVDRAIGDYEAAAAAANSNGDVEMKDGTTATAAVHSDSRFQVTTDTKVEQFIEYLKEIDNEKINALSKDDWEEIFNAKMQVALKRQADEKRRAERKQRHLQDDLRYALKKLSEPLDLSISYEDAVPLMEGLAEYQAIEDEESRKTAFTKFIKRQKEKQRETVASEDGSTTGRKRKEPHRDDYERDRDYRRKDYEGRSGKHHYRDEYDYHRSKDYDRDYRSGKRRDNRRTSKSDYRDWDESRSHDRGRGLDYRERDYDERYEKRGRYERTGSPHGMDTDKKTDGGRSETPEEGEI